MNGEQRTSTEKKCGEEPLGPLQSVSQSCQKHKNNLYKYYITKMELGKECGSCVNSKCIPIIYFIGDFLASDKGFSKIGRK